MAETIQFAPERRRGEQQARFGRGGSVMKGGGGIHKQLTRKRMSPNEFAAWKLNQALSKYPIFTEEGRQNLQEEFSNMPELRTMNVNVLAATLSFLQSIGNNPTPDTFRDEIILPHISLLLPNKEMDNDERQRLIIRFKAQILTYIVAISIFRAE